VTVQICATVRVRTHTDVLVSRFFHDHDWLYLSYLDLAKFYDTFDPASTPDRQVMGRNLSAVFVTRHLPRIDNCL